jgi:hypothetical protein
MTIVRKHRYSGSWPEAKLVENRKDDEKIPGNLGITE